MVATLGPWYTSREDGEVYSTSEHKSVALVYKSEDFEGNAKLIDAVHDLFEVVVSFSDHYPIGINPFLDEAFRKSRLAIGKATGEGKLII